MIGSFKQHESYYLDDGNIVFLVEDILFRVHRFFLLRDSQVFRDMLSIPVPPASSSPEGSSDDNPIVLLQVKSADFALLLGIYYNPTFGHKTITIEEWFSILALADKWQMETLHKFGICTIRRLQCGPVDKVVACQRYDMGKGWAEKACIDICTRLEPLSMADAKKIGLEMCIAIAGVREQLLRSFLLTSGISVQLTHSYDKALISDAVTSLTGIQS